MRDDSKRSIFRIEAVKRNSRGGTEAILPRFSSPRIVWLLWSLIGLTIGGGVLLWVMRIPTYTPALAIPLPHEYKPYSTPTDTVTNEPLMAIIVPARNALQVRVGQQVFWSFTKNGPRVNRPIIAVEPLVRSPDKLKGLLGLHGETAASITEPIVIALVRLGHVPTDDPPSAYVGAVYQAEIHVGARRVISLLPLMSRFTGN